MRRRLGHSAARARSSNHTATITKWFVTTAAVATVTTMIIGTAHGFAYAPNFITKLIEEQTSLLPNAEIILPSRDLPNADSPPPPFVVRTRFPPEPNGYLHLGHAKAICFNFAVARSFQPAGQCHMRLDDTNPSKEDQEYVTSILEDVQWIQSGLYDTPVPWDGPVRKTSDYFAVIYDCAMALIRSGDAYVDSLSAEEMRLYRGTLTQVGRDSPYRTRTVQENIQLFADMKLGKYPDGAHVVRAKIDMASPNINLRDPTLYRIKHESHQETGDTWCIYPMYDFSHPISDALEHITHSLCTLEFEDHRPFYDWTIQKLCQLNMLPQSPSSSSPSSSSSSVPTTIPKPQQIEFSRLNIKSTVLSKRKLIQLVQDRHVTGWDDPRLPTLSGFRRRGVPPAAIRLFCERIGISKADSNIDYSVLEDSIRETMDTTCPRAFAILDPLLVTITNLPDDYEEMFTVDRHPKLSMGQRTIPFKKQLYIERSDFFDLDGPEGMMNQGNIPSGFKRLLPNGGRVRLRYAYVLQCENVIRDPITNEPIELQCTYMKETRAGVTPEGMERVGGIIHWVEASTSIPCTIHLYDRLFSTEEPGKDSGDFLLDINPNSLSINAKALMEPSVWDDVAKSVESESNKDLSSFSYQFERSGYFALDKSSSDRNHLVFNRVVTLRDTWGGTEKANDKASQQQQRSRGNAKTAGIEEVPDNATSNESLEVIRRVAFRAATILSVEQNPESENFLICQVDCGDALDVDNGTSSDSIQPRTVVAGLAGKIKLDEMIGRKVLAITNFKPKKICGTESSAMLLAASNGLEGSHEVVELLDVPADIPNGELITFEGKDLPRPDLILKSKGAIKAWERVKSNLQVNDMGEAIYTDESGSAHRMVTSSGPIRMTKLKNAIIQ